jgi:hypothetical protein
MPSGQRRVYEPYYYYDFESKSACRKLHIRVYQLSDSSGAPNPRGRV